MTIDYLPWQRPDSDAARPCVRDAAHDLTYGEFVAWVEATAEQLAEHGVQRGSVVALMLPNRVELLVAMVAAWRLGAAATPVNPVFTATEADYQIGDSGAEVVVNEGPGAPDGGRPTIAVAELRRTATAEVPPPVTAAEDTALLIYTSGSTGRPKGVVLDHANLVAMTSMLTEHLGATAQDHALLVLPLFHVNAIVVSFLVPMMAGGRLSVLPRFSPREFLDRIAALRPTYFSAVPTIYAHLVAAAADGDIDTSSLRAAICGAAPASKELLESAERVLGCPVIEGYGLTEGTCASTANPMDGERRLGTVGPALPGQTIAIMRPDGSLAPTGERGEVVIKGENVMRGYLGKPDASADALRDGWLHTGDVGILDQDGYLRLVDRIKDMIIRGGENIYPKEIEEVLHRNPAVMEAAVVGKPDEVYGEVPLAYVATFPDAHVTTDELDALCRRHLTKVKVPVEIRLRESLPKNPVGKIDKPTLRSSTTPSVPIPERA